MDEKRLSDVLGSDADGWELQVKDLGPQVSWKTVFVVEYVSLLVGFFVIGLPSSLGYPRPWVILVLGLSSSLGYPMVLGLSLSLS